MIKFALPAALALATLLLLTVSPQPSTAAITTIDRNVALLQKPVAVRRALQAVNFRQELVIAINAKRSERGLRALCINDKLMTAAQVMANDMAKNNLVSTTGSDGSSPTDRAKSQRYNSTVGVTELVGAGYESAADAVAAWIKSSDTRSTLFGDVAHVGPGYTFNKNQLYWNYWAVDFATGGANETCSNAV